MTAERHFAKIHRILPGAHGHAEIEFSLRNAGTLPAEGAIVEFMASGGIALVETERLEAPRADLPSPPEPPAWEMSRGTLGDLMELYAALRARTIARGPALMLPDVSRWPGHHHAPSRDPYTFYRRDQSERAVTRKWSFGCAEFRHGGAPETFKASILTVGLPNGGAVRVRVSARNLPVAVEASLPVRIVSAIGDAEGEARALIELLARAERLRRRFPPASRS